MKYQYELTYEKRSPKWNELTKEIMRPVHRQLTICIPQCINKALDSMEDGEADHILSGLIEKHIYGLVYLLIQRMENRGGKKDAEI